MLVVKLATLMLLSYSANLLKAKFSLCSWTMSSFDFCLFCFFYFVFLFNKPSLKIKLTVYVQEKERWKDG